MSEIPQAGPVEHIVEVNCNLDDYVIKLPDSLALKPGDLMVWSFLGIPEGWSPWIQFLDEDDLGFLGPFDNLVQTATGVWGRCRTDLGEAERSFTYMAAVQKGIGLGGTTSFAMVSSAESRLRLVSSETGTRRVFTVRPQAGSEHKLDVTPLGVVIHPGDTVDWVFEGLDEDPAWRPRVNFRRYDGSGAPSNLLLGPFTSLTYKHGSVEGKGNSNVSGTYYFEVAVVKLESGEVLWRGSGDPAIDNRGGAGDAGSGGGSGG